MNAYLFSAGVTQSQIQPAPDRYGRMVDNYNIWDGCLTGIVISDDAAAAQQQFEAWCSATPDGANPRETEIKKLQVAQLVDQLFTETGGVPLDWTQIASRTRESLQVATEDAFEQGYWVEVNEVVPPGKISGDIETLRQSLAEDIRSGLNWAPEKKFFFLITVFSPPATTVLPGDDAEADAENPDAGAAPLDRSVAVLPDLRDKEAAALVEARNSVVAAWLWRKYAVDTRLAANEIMVSECNYIPAAD